MNILRRFRYSLRLLFVIVTVGCFWLGYQINWIRERHQFIRALPKEWKVEWASGGPSPFSNATEEIKAPWSLRILGEPAVEQIGSFHPRKPQWYAEAKRLFPEAKIVVADGHHGEY